MKKAWVYISTFLLGVIAGIVTMYKLMGDRIEVNVRRIKSKGVSGTSSVTIPINIDKPEKRSKMRKAKRSQRRLDKLKNKL